MITIQIKNKENNKISNPISLEEIIYRQNDIEFEFGENYEDENYETCTYSDFLYFQENFEVIIKKDGKQLE